MGAELDIACESDIIKEKSKHRESNDRRDGREGGVVHKRFALAK